MSKPELMLRTIIPLRNAAHGVRIAQELDRKYNGISSVVHERTTVIDFSEIQKFTVADDNARGAKL